MKIQSIVEFIWLYKTVIAIFLLALFLRVFQLTAIPHGFHFDEVVSGYIGRFVLLNGKDVYGNTFPLFYFDSFGDFRTILPMYINGLSTFLFGVTVFAVRFPTALIGSITVFPIYLLSKMLLKNAKMTYVPSLVFALLPWSIVLSRATEEAVVGLTLITCALYFLFMSIAKKKFSLLFIGNLLLLISYFIYPTFRLLSPLLLLPFPLLTHVHKKWYIASIIFFFTISGLFFLTPYGQGRFQQTSLFASKELTTKIHSDNIAYQYDEGNSGNSAFIARVFHNNVTGYAREIEAQYTSYFSPSFLFLQGGLPERYVVPLAGLLYSTFGFLLIGLVLPTRVIRNNKIYVYLLYLLFISPIPAVLTLEDVPNINRAILMSLALSFLIGIGFAKIYSLFTNKSYRIIFCCIILVATLGELIYFEHEYFAISPSYTSFYRNDGNEELVQDLKKYPVTTRIIIPLHDMPMYYLFFNNNFNKSIIGTFKKNLIVKQINNITFSEDPCPTKRLTLTKEEATKTIIVEGDSCTTSANYTILTTITRRDSTMAYRILSKSP